MADLTLIHRLPDSPNQQGPAPEIKLRAPRTSLAKRRWRGTAEDGREFGFDLDATLCHGVLFFVCNESRYVIQQEPEDVLEIPFSAVEEAARVAWGLGNLHFGVQVLPKAVRVTEDPAVLQFLSREAIAFHRVKCVFLPLSTASSAHHAHSHHHGE